MFLKWSEVRYRRWNGACFWLLAMDCGLVKPERAKWNLNWIERNAMEGILLLCGVMRLFSLTVELETDSVKHKRVKGAVETVGEMCRGTGLSCKYSLNFFKFVYPRRSYQTPPN